MPRSSGAAAGWAAGAGPACRFPGGDGPSLGSLGAGKRGPAIESRPPLGGQSLLSGLPGVGGDLGPV